MVEDFNGDRGGGFCGSESCGSKSDCIWDDVLVLVFYIGIYV